MNRRKIGILCLITSGALFGTSPLANYIAAMLGSNSDTFLVTRCLTSIPVFCLILLIFKIPFKMPAEGLRDGFIGSLLNTLCALMLITSYNYVGGGIATTLHFVYPVFVMVLSFIVFKANINLIKISALICAVGGVALISAGDENVSTFGVILAVGSGFVYSVYILFLEHSKLNLLHPMQFGLLNSTSMTVFSFIYSSMFAKSFDISAYSAFTWLLGLVTVIAISVGAQPLFQVGVQHTDGPTGALLSTTEPITAVILGCLCMGEGMTIRKFIGCVCILSGVFLVILGESYLNRKNGSDAAA